MIYTVTIQTKLVSGNPQTESEIGRTFDKLAKRAEKALRIIERAKKKKIPKK